VEFLRLDAIRETKNLLHLPARGQSAPASGAVPMRGWCFGETPGALQQSRFLAIRSRPGWPAQELPVATATGGKVGFLEYKHVDARPGGSPALLSVLQQRQLSTN